VRATRRGLLDRLKRLGPMLGPSITAHLSDERWYVQRNLLTLLEELPDLPMGFSVLPWVSHADPRVRLEAFKIGLKSRDERDRVITQALSDNEHRVVRLALIAALQGVPAPAVPHLIGIVNNKQGPPDLRLQAIRVLGLARTPESFDVLLSLVDGGRTILGRRKLLPRSREMVTALTALATGWGTEPRALELLARAAVSDDPAIRAATDPETAAT
jgi:HEAT repeat protein